MDNKYLTYRCYRGVPTIPLVLGTRARELTNLEPALSQES